MNKHLLYENIMYSIATKIKNILNEVNYNDVDHTHNNQFSHLKQRLVGILTNMFKDCRITLIDKSAREFDSKKKNVDIIIRNRITKDYIGCKIIFKKSSTKTNNFRITTQNIGQAPNDILNDPMVNEFIFIEGSYEQFNNKNICVGYTIYFVDGEVLTNAYNNKEFVEKSDRNGKGFLIPFQWIDKNKNQIKFLDSDSKASRDYDEIIF